MIKQAFVIATEDDKECIFAETPDELACQIQRVLHKWKLNISIRRQDGWDQYYQQEIPASEWTAAGYYVPCRICDTLVVFNEWYDIDGQPFCCECAEEYLSQHVALCKCGARPVVYVRSQSEVYVECPECEKSLSYIDGEPDHLLAAWKATAQQ